MPPRVAGNFRSFQFDLDRFADQIELDVGLVRKKVTFDLFGKVIERTPVDVGRLRMSWAMADGVPPQSVGPEGGTGGDANAADAAARFNITSAFSDPFEVTWIVNNLPYAQQIEFGHSRVKAPAGMVRVSIAELEVELGQISGIDVT